MNPLVIALAVFASATVATFHWRHERHVAEAELVRLHSEENELRGQLSASETRLDQSAKSHQANLNELAAVREELRQSNDAVLALRKEPDPATEGMWPTNKPYFHLSKRRLRDLGFVAIGSDGQPTAPATAILGMSTRERHEFAQTWAEFQRDLQQLQARAAERIPDTNHVADPNRRAVQFRLASVSNEVKQLQAQLGQRIEVLLGSTRAELLAAPLQDRAQQLMPPIVDDNVLLTYYAERQPDGTILHFLRFDDAARRTMYQYPVVFIRPDQGMTDGESHSISGLKFPLDPDSPLWSYRHLFGDQPLLTE